MKNKKDKPTKQEHFDLKKFLKKLKTKDGKDKYSNQQIDELVGIDENTYTREEYTNKLILEMREYPKSL